MQVVIECLECKRTWKDFLDINVVFGLTNYPRDTESKCEGCGQDVKLTVSNVYISRHDSEPRI